MKKSLIISILMFFAFGIFFQAALMADNPNTDPNKKKKKKGTPPVKVGKKDPGNSAAGTSDECPCSNGGSGGGDDDNKCIYFSIPFGKDISEPSNPLGKFIVYSNLPSPLLCTAQGLYYSYSAGTSKIIKNETSELPEGIARRVTILTVNDAEFSYSFKTGESIANCDLGVRSVLKMVDANGNAVTSNPVYYDRHFSTGSMRRYDAVTGQQLFFRNPQGRNINQAASQIEIINDENGVIRQVKAPDGLADIITINGFKYQIKLYSVANAGTKNATSGLYEPTGNPEEVYTIENPTGDVNNIGHIKKTASIGTYTFITEFIYNPEIQDWKMIQGSDGSGNGLKISFLENYSKDDQEIINDVVTDGAGTVLQKVQTHQTFLSNGNEIITAEINDPDGAALTTSYTHYLDDESAVKYGYPKTKLNPDGSWETYEYDSEGRMTLKVQAYKDSAFNSSAANAKATYYSYTPVDASDTLVTNDQRPRTEEVKILGTSVAKNYYAYYTDSETGEYTEIEERCTSPSNSYGNAANLRTTKTYYSPSANAASKGRLKKVVNPDGTITSYTYENGNYTASPGAPGSFTAGTGDALRTTMTNGTTSSPSGVANKSTRMIMVSDAVGDEVLRETYAYDGSAYNKVAWTVKVFNDDHKVVSTASSNNTETEATWMCCGKTSETTAEGTEYTYSYNLLKQRTGVTKEAATDIVTTNVFDAVGRRLSSTTAAGGLSLGTSATYDKAGRMLSSTDVSGLTTTYAYVNGGRTVTMTSKGATTITDKYLDGRIKSVTGTAVIPKYYDYSVDGSGNQITTVYTAVNSGPRYVKTTVDALGRVIKTEQPAYGSGTVVSQNTYNNDGDLIKTTQTGLADTIYEYDDLGNVIRSGLDIDANGSLTLASTDRISDSDTVFANEAGTWYQTTTNKTYATDSDATATTTGVSKRQLTGFASNITARSVSIDINGNTTTSTTSLDRSNKTVTQTTDVPDSTTNAVSTTVNGLLTAQTTAQNLTYTYGYDALGRRTSVTDPRTGASTTAYYANGVGKIGKVHTVTDAASNTTTFDYSSTTGRRTKVTNALNKDTEYLYNTRGQVTGVSGPATYPLGYIYDSYGAMSELHTYRDGLTPDKTTWIYDSATGLLTSKKDANNKSVTYTYDSSNRLSTRSWARLDGTNPLTTTYAYSSSTGELTSVDYSDTTPDIAYTYNRLGQQKTVADAVGTRTFTYNAALQPQSEAITGMYNKTINRSYATTGMVGRYTGLSLPDGYSVSYSYDTYGRFSTVTNGSDVFTYAYLANSNLVSSITYPNNITVTNAYESNRNLIDYVENKHNTTTISKYDYTNDALGRRTAMEKSGTAFSATDTINYSYNDRSEVTGADAVTDANYNFGFDYDHIGNRKTYDTTESGSNVQSVYTANNLNQYTNITNPSQSPSYDDDGNMLTMTLASGSWTNTFNAENRIIAQEKSDARLEYMYDYMGRRVEKKVYSGSTGNWTLDEHWRFAYNGYLQIEKLDGLNGNAISEKSLWGMGARIFANIHGSNIYYTVCDANRNISEYVDSSGTIQAHYEYSPFGKVVKKTGTMADTFGYRFSSEIFDSETGLVYYNYRYYSPELGRWSRKDPIAEAGGNNLYGMVNNNPIVLFDYLGNGFALWKNEKPLSIKQLTPMKCLLKELGMNKGSTKGAYNALVIAIHSGNVYEGTPIGVNANGYSNYLTGEIIINSKLSTFRQLLTLLHEAEHLNSGGWLAEADAMMTENLLETKIAVNDSIIVEKWTCCKKDDGEIWKFDISQWEIIQEKCGLGTVARCDQDVWIIMEVIFDYR